MPLPLIPAFLHPRNVKTLLIESAKQWSRQRASSKGAALSLYMVFSLAPMLILVIAVAGFFFGEAAVQAELVGQLRDLTGERGAEVVQTVLASAHESGSGGIAALISICVLLFSATTAFNELKASLDEIWEVPPESSGGIKGLVQARLQAFGLILILALFLLFSLSVNAGLAAARRHYGAFWTHEAFAQVGELVAATFSFAVVTALFAVVYKLLPSVRIGWKDVIPGALVTALLFVVGKWGIGLYLGQDSVASAYGAAGSVIALLLWIFYSAQIFFYGAVFTRQYALMRADAKKVHIQPMRPGDSPPPAT